MNIMAAAAVDREFWCIYASFELTLKCPGMLWGLHCAPFVPLWGTFGVSLGHLGQSWGALWATWAALGRPGGALELLWGCLGTILGLIGKKVSAGTPIASRWLSSTAPAHKNRPAGICPAVPGVPGVPAVTGKRSTNYSSGPPFHTRRGSG